MQVSNGSVSVSTSNTITVAAATPLAVSGPYNTFGFAAGQTPTSFPPTTVGAKGGSVTLAAVVTGGSGTYSYQWFQVGSPSDTQVGTGATFTTPNPLAVADSGSQFYLVVTDSTTPTAQTATSSKLTLRVGTFTAITGTSTQVPSSNRFGHTATRLNDGRVLLVGGLTHMNGTAVTTAEIYDPVAKTFTLTGSPATFRFRHDAVLLTDGTVLIFNGTNSTGATWIPSAEIFDPAANAGVGAFTTLDSAQLGNHIGRTQDAVVLLPSHDAVLIAGGQAGGSNTDTAEIFSPATASGTFQTITVGGNPHLMPQPTSALAGTLLGGGDQVLLTGGIVGTQTSPTAATEQFTFATTFSVNPIVAGPSLKETVANHVAAAFGNEVLVAGGQTGAIGTGSQDAELYPGAGSFGYIGDAGLTPPIYGNAPGGIGMPDPFLSPVAVSMPDGTLLLAGGQDGFGFGQSAADLYDPFAGKFLQVGPMLSQRHGHTATLLTDGTVLLFGGDTGNSQSPSPVAEIFSEP